MLPHLHLPEDIEQLFPAAIPEPAQRGEDDGLPADELRDPVPAILAQRAQQQTARKMGCADVHQLPAQTAARRSRVIRHGDEGRDMPVCLVCDEDTPGDREKSFRVRSHGLPSFGETWPRSGARRSGGGGGSHRRPPDTQAGRGSRQPNRGWEIMACIYANLGWEIMACIYANLGWKNMACIYANLG